MKKKVDHDSRGKDMKFHARDKDGDNNKRRTNISITGDLIIKHITRFSISKNNVSIFSHSGITTEGLTDYMFLFL